MRAYATNRRAMAGSGMFAGNPPLPQDPPTAIKNELQQGLMGDPGLRLMFTTGRRLYTGGAVTVQDTLRGDGGPNAPETISAGAANGAINSRRALSRFRGFPAGTAPEGF